MSPMDPARVDAVKAASVLYGTLADPTKANGLIDGAHAAVQAAMAVLARTDAERAELTAAGVELRAAIAAANDVRRIATAAERCIALSAPSAAPKILTGAECTWPPPRIRGIGGHLAISVGRPTAIVSPGGCGKGMLAMSLAWSVATGEPMGELGIMGEPGPVLWLDYEETLPMLHARHARYRAGLEPVPAGAGDLIHYVDCMAAGMTLDSPSFVAWLKAELPRHRLCVVDHLTEAWSAPIDWNQPEARLPLKAANALSDETGCPFVVLGHVNKPPAKGSSGGTADRWRGSTALRGAVISLWVGDETTTPHQARWTHAKANSGPKARPFLSTVVDDDAGGYRVELALTGEPPGGPQSLRRAEEGARIQAAILKALAECPGLGTRGIRTAVGGSKDGVDGELELLIAHNRVAVTPGSRNARTHRLVSEVQR